MKNEKQKRKSGKNDKKILEHQFIFILKSKKFIDKIGTIYIKLNLFFNFYLLIMLVLLI